MMEALNESRRERKKRATRDAIAATARRLFAERGFDAVTMAEIATAADVAEKTVYNHFPTKEDLAFTGREQNLRALLTRIAQRPLDASVLDVFRAATEEMIGDLAAGGDEETVAVRRIILGSPALQERLTTGWEEEAAALAAVIGKTAVAGKTAAVGETVGAAAEDIIPAVVGRTLVWTHRAILRAALAGLLAGEDSEQLAGRLRLAADRAYDQLAGGLGEYGRGANELEEHGKGDGR